MRAPAWWRRWFGGKPASPTGPASPSPGVERDLSAFYSQFPPDVEPYKSEPGAIIPPFDRKLLVFPGLSPIPPRPGTFVEALPGSLPFDFIADTAAAWNSVLKSPDALVHVLPPEFSVVTINREELAQKRAVRHAHAIRTFNLEFARLVRVEADGNYSRMARRLGVAPSVVGRWASGKLSPSIHNFLKFCVEYEYVLGDFTGTDEFE